MRVSVALCLPRGVRVGQIKALRKVEPMMGINGWEMSTNMAVYRTGGCFLNTYTHFSCELISEDQFYF